MTEVIIQLLLDIAKLGVPFAILLLGLIYFYKENKNLKDKIVSLQEDLNKSEKEHLITLHKSTALMQKFVQKVNLLMSKNKFTGDEE